MTSRRSLLASLAASAAVLFATLRIAVGCSSSLSCGAGTHAQDGLCLADEATVGQVDSGAAPDAAVPQKDGGGISLSPDDVLRVGTHNGGADMELLVDTRICFELTVLHSDGTKTAVAPGSGAVTVAAKRNGLVAEADAGDCDTGGLLGTSAGLTALTVSLTSGGVTISGSGTATVDASPLRLTAYPGTETQAFHIAAGATTNANVLSSEERRDGTFYLGELYFQWGPTTGTRPRDAELVTRWLAVTIADTSLASVSHRAGNHGDMWRFEGLTLGASTVAVDYNGPHGTAHVSRPLKVVARPTITPPEDQIGIVLLGEGDRILTDGFVHPVNLGPDTCYMPQMYARVSQGLDAPLTFDLDVGVTFSQKTAGAATSAPGKRSGESCIGGSGITRITGCWSSSCRTLPISSYQPGALQKIELLALSSDPVPGSIQMMQYVFCPNIRATATLASGTSFDVTTVGRWGFASAQDSRVTGSLAYTPFSPPDADDASPCFGINSGGGAPKGLTGPGTTPVTASASYQGLTAKLDVVAQGTMPQ